MMKFNIKIVSIIVVILILLVCAFLIIPRTSETFNIKIYNKTAFPVSNLEITYDKITKDILIPVIASKSSYKLMITPKEVFGENTMWIIYKDKKGDIHKEAIFGYFEKGYSGKASVNIVDIDQNGVIKFTIKRKIKI